MARKVSELAAFVGQVIKVTRVDIEGGRRERDVALMRRDVLELFRRQVVEIDIRIRRGVGFGKGDVLFIIREIAEIVTGSVLIEQLTLKSGDIHFVDVE